MQPFSYAAPSRQRLSIYDRILANQPGNLLAYLPLNDTNGTTAVNRAPGVAGINTMENPGFEQLGTGAPDVYSRWGESAGNGTIVDATSAGEIHGGAHACKLTAGASANTLVYNILSATPGKSCTLSIWTRGDGANAGRYVVYDQTHGAYIRNTTSTGVTGTSFAEVTYTFTVPVGCISIQYQFYCPTANGGYCYFDDISVTAAGGDATAFDGTYTGGYTQNQSGLSGSSVLLNGTTGYINLSRAAYANHLPAAAGSYVVYGKTTLAALIDGTSRWLMKFKSTDALNYIDCFKNSTNNQLGWQNRDDTSGQIFYVTSWSTAVWFSMTCTWSVANGCRHYLNGLQVGGATAIGGAMTHPINYGIMALGYAADANTFWIGNLQHFAMWNAELTANQVLYTGRL